MNIFNIAEVIDIGIEKEKKRRDFYKTAAERFNDKDIKSLFGKLKEWEDAHVKKFTEIRNSVEVDETFESFPGELTAYMKALVDDMLYKKVSPANFARNVRTPLDAITYGMGFEKDSIIFFHELAKRINDDTKETVNKLVAEEKQHLIYLSELKSKAGLRKK